LNILAHFRIFCFSDKSLRFQYSIAFLFLKFSEVLSQTDSFNYY
jgi:hypothetical protein